MPLAKVNGINIGYDIEGTGPPLVLIMGLGVDRSGWRYQVPAFRNSYRVVTFDNRGVGLSDKPPGPYSPALMAEDTIGLMGLLEIEKAHIMGISMGGLIAQEIAINYPGRVFKLVLGSTWACQDNETNGITPDMLAATDLPPRQGFKRLLDASVNKFFIRFVLVPLLKLRVRRVKESEFAGIKAQVEGIKKFDSRDRLPSIKAPTLVLTGSKDRVVKPGSSVTLSQKIPGARVVMIKNGSHAVSMEKTKEFNREVLEFLQS